MRERAVLAGAKDKCSQCKREWSIRKGSVLEGLKIPLHKFVLALKLFELEVPALRASKELGLAYNTVHKLFQLIRKKIYQQSVQSTFLVDILMNFFTVSKGRLPMFL